MRLVILISLLSLTAWGQAAPPATAPTTAPATLPHIQVDVPRKQVRVECEPVTAGYALEFFCVVSGGNEHETILRTSARPSHVHLALLMLGLQPGHPAQYSEAASKWFPPQGPPLHLSVEYQKDGKTVRYPAQRLMRSLKDQKAPPPMTWIFTGSILGDDGSYAADITGNIVSVVNVETALIDVADVASKAMEARQWEYDPKMLPEAGAKVWLIIEPAGQAPATQAAEEMPAAPERLSDVRTNAQEIKRLRGLWDKAVAPHQQAVREAAQAHYDVINALRREQQRLIDEADRIQRLIDQLEKQYQDMTTPHPEPVGQ